MEEGQKKIIMLILVVACIAAAIGISVALHSGGGIDSIDPKDMVWLKCRNPKCEHTWQMNKKAFYEYADKHRVGMEAPPVPCPKCGDETGYRAEKCEKCGLIFERGSVPNAIADKCPKCGFSKLESLGEPRRGSVVEESSSDDEE